MNSVSQHSVRVLFLFSVSSSTPSPPLRRGGAVSSGFCVQDLADLQEGVPSTGGLHLDHRLWMGLHAAQWADAAGTGAPGPFDAQRFVFLTVTVLLSPTENIGTFKSG